MTSLVTLLIVTHVCVTSAQIMGLGWCPEYVAKTNFDMNRFLGRWYETERYFTVTELATRCVTTIYAKSPEGKIVVSNRITNTITGVKRTVDGSVTMAGRLGEGKITVKYDVPLSFDTTFSILDTDYDNFAVLWACSGIGPIHTQNAWIMTRERRPTDSTIQKAYAVLDSFKLGRTFFLKTNQERCLAAADDLEANGLIDGGIEPVDEFEGQKSAVAELDDLNEVKREEIAAEVPATLVDRRDEQTDGLRERIAEDRRDEMNDVLKKDELIEKLVDGKDETIDGLKTDVLIEKIEDRKDELKTDGLIERIIEEKTGEENSAIVEDGEIKIRGKDEIDGKNESETVGKGEN